MDTISVERKSDEDPMIFGVTVGGEGERTHHEVSLDFRVFERLTHGACSPEDCVKAAFRFLLDREPKHAILARFGLITISNYFPEFENELERYLPRKEPPPEERRGK